MQEQLTTGTTGAAIANAFILLVIGYAAFLFTSDPDLYYLTVQEDEYLEWATFWAFFGAAVASIISARHQHRGGQGMPWFLGGVALFCLFVALEEISWGQRVFGYRPPEYFLGNNFQQEFNLHNVVDSAFRKYALITVILGYGVALPALQRLPVVGPLSMRLGVIAPPLSLMPLFIAAYVLYVWYPWSHSGEWVELLLGVGFLLSAIVAVRHFGPGSSSPSGRLLAAAAVAIIGLGLATAVAGRYQRLVNPGEIDAAESELQALKEDFQSGKVRMRCGLHKRLYSFVAKYEQTYLNEGSFAQLTMQGLPVARAEFFLDPWNSPYWIRYVCASMNEPQMMFVYSLGPNRRRDSSRDEILGDDLGEHLGYSRR